MISCASHATHKNTRLYEQSGRKLSLGRSEIIFGPLGAARVHVYTLCERNCRLKDGIVSISQNACKIRARLAQEMLRILWSETNVLEVHFLRARLSLLDPHTSIYLYTLCEAALFTSPAQWRNIRLFSLCVCVWQRNRYFE